MVFALGVRGHLACLDGATGKPIWEKDLLQEYGIPPEEEEAVVLWGRSASPLVVGEKLIVPIGGRKGGRLVTLAAFDKRRGTLLWEGGQRQISYCSPSLATLGGVEQILIVNEDTASGHDAKTGKPLWEHDRPGHTNRDPNVSQAVPIAPNLVFLSKGYGGGAMLLAARSGSRRRLQDASRLGESARHEDQVRQRGDSRRLRLRALRRHSGMHRGGQRTEQMEAGTLRARTNPPRRRSAAGAHRGGRGRARRGHARSGRTTCWAASRRSRGSRGTTWRSTARICWCETPKRRRATSCRWKKGNKG